MKGSNIIQTYFERVKSNALYGGVYDGIDHYADAPSLPKSVLVKLLNERFDIHNENSGVYLVRSGGTTQNPLIFPVDIDENFAQREMLARSLTKHRIITPQTVGLNLFTYGLIYRTASIVDDLFERCKATTLPVSAEAKDADVFSVIRLFTPDMLFGSPSRLAIFAQYLVKNNLRVSIPNVLFGGEFMVPSYQRIFAEMFDTKNIYALYGSAETGIWAWSLYSAEPSLYRVMENIHVEIFHPDADGFGNVVVTNLMRKRFPVFRYDLGDIGRLVTRNDVVYLELKSRDARSFFLDSSNLSVDDFSEITADADTFQIQVHSGDNIRNELKILLVKQVPGSQQQNYIEAKTKMVRSLIHVNNELVDVKVELVEIGQLFINKVTSKIPQLIDFRK